MNMSNILGFPYEDIPFVLLVILIAFTLHEFAHAFFAYKFGDPTAKDQGRVTLNPMAHLDIIGIIFILVAGFGWARPVPVNRSYFRKPRLMGIIVSIAGPISNLLIAFAGMLIYVLVIYYNLMDHTSPGVRVALDRFFYYLINLNVMLFIFNLIPIPPLDGYRIVQDLAPNRVRAWLSQYEHWAVFILLLLVFIPQLNRHTLQPIFAFRICLVSHWVESAWKGRHCYAALFHCA
jgi:Zn-dependent protease